MKTIRIVKPDRILQGRINLPSSKSISNRLLIMQALSGADFTITNLSKANDTVLLQKLLNKIKASAGEKDAVELDCSDAGTDLRFLTAILAIKPGRWVITGSDRMKQRPVGDLVESLKQLGAAIEYLGNVGFPPLLIKGRNLVSSELLISAGVSSQFVSALLMTAPCLPEGLTLNLKGEVVSEPYIDMTINLLKECGINAKKWKHKIRVEPGMYTCRQFTVESDWSAASFWYQAAALTETTDFMLPGLNEKSLQGDSELASAFTVFGVKSEFIAAGDKEANCEAIMGTPKKSTIGANKSEKRKAKCGKAMNHEPGAMSNKPSPENFTISPFHHFTILPFTLHLSKQPVNLEGFYYDFTHHPDLALPMIATCAALGIRGRFEGLKNLVIKESDRLRSLTSELNKLGCKINLIPGDYPVIEIQPSSLISRQGTVIETYRDHRMAMTFAMLALKTGSITLNDPDVVNKSYPGFWDDLESAGFRITLLTGPGRK